MNMEPGPCSKSQLPSFQHPRWDEGQDGGTTYTFVEGATGPDEEPSADRTANGDHVQMTGLHAAVKLDDAAAILLALEGLDGQTVAGGPRLVGVVELGDNVLRRGPVMASRALLTTIGGNGILGRHGGRTAKGVTIKRNASRGSPIFTVCLRSRVKVRLLSRVQPVKQSSEGQT
jgi:hypothetical protein